MPRASVVIPCYNCESYIEETIASVTAQTMADFELVCVDNNSSDSTRDVLERLARSDKRIRVIDEKEPGEGPARDAGLKVAQGTWLYFLDSDDLMEPTLLEEAIARGEQTAADIVVFKTTYLDAQSSERRPCPECFDIGWIENWKSDLVFTPRDNPSQLLTSFQNWVHNKLFRASFVKEQDLSFQHVHRMADILFTCKALTSAQTIALLDRPLHLYRTNNPQSALVTSDPYALDFYDAFLALRNDLEQRDVWNLYHDTYVCWAEEAVAMNLYRTRSFEAFSLIANTMKEEGLKRLDIDGFDAEKAFSPLRHETCMAIRDKSLAELAFMYLSMEKRRMGEVETDFSRCRVYLGEVKGSTSFKLGNKIVSPIAKVAKALKLRS